MRAIRARYDPFLQTRHRVEQLKSLGHSTDKVEFIVMGGTFMALPTEYRDYFIRNLHDALSGHRYVTQSFRNHYVVLFIGVKALMKQSGTPNAADQNVSESRSKPGQTIVLKGI